MLSLETHTVHEPNNNESGNHESHIK